MGGLREKAESEQTVREEAAVEYAHERLSERDERRKATIQPLLAFLSAWSGEDITESMLKPVPDPPPQDLIIGAPLGPPRWNIEIDGFELRVLVIDPRTDSFVIEHSPKDSDLWREIQQPHELLEPLIDPEAQPAGIEQP